MAEYIAHFKRCKNETDIVFEIHSLQEHLRKVAEGTKQIGAKIGFPYLFYLTGLLHDMGKYTDKFQAYMEEAMRQTEAGTYEIWAIVNRGKIDHGRLGAMYIYQKHISVNQYERMTAEMLAMVIAYHHGGLKDYLTYDCASPLLTRICVPFSEEDRKAMTSFEEEIENEEQLETLFQKACAEVKECIVARFQKANLEPQFALHLLIKFLYSAVIDMDRWDSMQFSSDRQIQEIELKEVLPAYQLRLQHRILEYEKRETHSELEEKIKKLRQMISDICYSFAGKRSGIYTLTVPTGGGKTVSSLRYALEHAKQWGKERVIYVLPYTTIIEQNAEEVRTILGCGNELLEHHSNAVREDESLYEEGEYGLYSQRWNVPIIFTTMVHYLDSFYKDGKRDMQRLHQMSNAILIFDEIQALPIKCITLFNEAANFLNKIGGSTIILCSATQPLLQNVKNPLLIAGDAEIIPNLPEKFHEFKRIVVRDIRKKCGYSYEELTDFMINKKKAVSSMLLILNTKKCVEEMYQHITERYSLESDVQIYYLSTQLCPAHRKEAIGKIKTALEKGESVICISTQLIEAGVDISFECVLRHLAGMDSIAQAAGRANRHGEGAEKEVYIVNLTMETLGSMIEIDLGEKHSEYLLNQYEQHPELLEGEDLLSPSVMKLYYSSYYKDKEIAEKMNYPIKIEGSSTTIADMLKAKTGMKTAYKAKYGKKFALAMSYPLETAGKRFQVIDENVFSVVVPYQKGKQVIAELFAKSDWNQKQQSLSLLQQYSVNIRESQKNRLVDKGAFEKVKQGEERIFVLKEAFYDADRGIVEDGKFDYLGF